MLIYEGNTYYKQITKDGRFINLAPDTETGVFYVSRQGTYELKEKNHYVETITHEWGEAIQPDKTDIVYTVKKGKLTLDFEKYGQQNARRVDRSHHDARLQDSQVTPVRRRSPRRRHAFPHETVPPRRSGFCCPGGAAIGAFS